MKASETAQAEDFKALKALQSRVVLLYCGQQSLPFGERLAALPISTVWRAGQDN